MGISILSIGGDKHVPRAGCTHMSHLVAIAVAFS